MNHGDAGANGLPEIVVAGARASVKREKEPGRCFDRGDAGDVQMLVRLARCHAGRHAVLASHRRRKHVDARLVHEVPRLLGGRQGRTGIREIMDLRTGADVTDFTLDDDGRADGLGRLHRALRLSDVGLEGELGCIEDHGVEARSRRLLDLVDRVGVVCVQVEHDAQVLPKTPDQRRHLASAEELPLALGEADDHGDASLEGDSGRRLQGHELRDVEVSERNLVGLRRLESLEKGGGHRAGSTRPTRSRSSCSVAVSRAHGTADSRSYPIGSPDSSLVP